MKKCLIVDDEEQNRYLLDVLLRGHGYETVNAENGAEALDKARANPPDIAITDVLMPVMDGFALCRAWKSDERLRDIPLVIYTATYTEAKDEAFALSLGADRFLIKPQDPEVLVEELKKILEKTANGSFIGAGQTLIENDFVKRHYETVIRKLEDKMAELQHLNARLTREIEEKEHAQATLEKEKQTLAEAEETLKKKNEELRDMTQQLWQAAKLATMGELAASIAHELNNPLTTVTLRVESLLEKIPEDNPNHRALAIIEQEVQRMSSLIANLLQFSRRGQPQISTVDICEEIEKTLDLVHYHLRKNSISIMRQFADNVPKIHADRQQLRQLFLNLFTNAADAMPHGGMLTLRVAAVSENKQIRIEVVDTGTGIATENLSKVTEPFYTTKPEGKGTGLGLAICRRIAQGHRGTIEITSDAIPGKGTQVCLTLPVSDSSTVDYLCR